MIALIGVEVRRLLARWLFIVLTSIVLLGLTVAGVAAFIASDDSAEAVAAARAERATAVERCIGETRASLRAGVEDYPPLAHEDTAAFCKQETWVSDPRFDYRNLEWMMQGFAMPLLILAWLIGASFVGAEWHNRTMTTILTWEPRRVRVLAAKALAAAAIVFLWVLAMQAAIAAAFYPAAAFEGSTRGIDAAWWGDFGLQAVRLSGIATVASLFGLSLATIGRNTAAALGVGFVYLAIVEGLIRAFRPSWVDWLVGDNIGLVLAGSEGPALGHSRAAAGLLVAVYAVTLLGGAAALFRRRDIA